MSRSSNQHTSPLQSTTQLALRQEVVSAGFDTEILRDLLWLTNAHDQLVAFPFFCQNAIQVLTTSINEWGISAGAFHLHEDSIKLLEWVVSEAPRLSSSLGALFGLLPKHASHNPLMGKGVTRHPTYSALCNSHAADQLKKKFRLLQGHLLYAQANELHSRNNRDEYENYGGQAPWKGLPNSPSLGCLAVRELSEAQFADTLLSLPVEQPPVAFAQSLDNLPQVDNSDFVEHLKGLRSFLQKSSGIRNWIVRQHAGGTGSGGGDHIHGHVEITSQIYQTEIALGDSDDADNNWGDLVQVTSIAANQEAQRELLVSDLYPDELDDQNLFLTGSDTQTISPGGIAANRAAQMRHVLMSNQLLPWNYQQLAISEVSAALSQCADWVNSTFNQSHSALAKDGDIKKLEAICLMRTMLFTGSSIARARDLLLLPHGKEGEDSVLAFILNGEGVLEWRVRAIRPQYRTSQIAQDGSDRKRTDYFTLPDTGITSRYVKLLLEQLSKTVEKSERSLRVFISRENTLRANLTHLLTELDPTGRLTESKLSKFLFFRLLDESHGDVCVASLITGDEHRLSHVRLFYSMVSVEQLQQIYMDATQQIVSLLFSATGKVNPLVAPSLTHTKDRYVGSRLCPTFEAVRNAITRISDEIQINAQRKNLVTAHNLYTLLTVWHFAFPTACRAIETPYMALAEIDRLTGIALLADKDDGTHYKARLTWLPPLSLLQMERNELYQSELILGYPYLGSENTPIIFFLAQGRNEHLKPSVIRPKTMEPLMEPFLPYPANFHRRFMRTELLARGCPIEVVDAYMGHWSLGEEPWSTYSSFTFQQYRDEMERYLIPLLDEIGLNGRFNPSLAALFHQPDTDPS